MADYGKTHIVTAGYLRRFTDRGLVQPVRKGAAVADRPMPAKSPNKVGFRQNFFTDGELAEKAEKEFNKFETRGLEALRRIKSTWPLERGSGYLDRLAIAGLVAVHMVRNPAFQHYQSSLQAAHVDQVIQEGFLSPEAELGLIEEVTAEAFSVDHLLSVVPKTASLIASAHWTLIEFPDRLLATSDQPVTVVPILPEGTRAPIAASPRSGFVLAEEFRFPIDPENALLFTWAAERDADFFVPGTDNLAANLNRAVISQADREWFHHPLRRPTALPLTAIQTDDCSPIGRHLLPNYGPTQAATSPRRLEAKARLDTMIENEITSEFHVVRVGVVSDDNRRFPTRHYEYDTRAEPVECEQNPHCPVCDSEWLGIREDGELLLADCAEDHRFHVKTIKGAIGEPTRFTIGDRLTQPTSTTAEAK